MIMSKTKLLTLFVLLSIAVGAMAQAGLTVRRAAYSGEAGAPSTEWAVGDNLYVYGVSSTNHDQVLMGTLKATAAGAEAFMAGTLDFSQTGTEVPMTLTLSNLPLPMDYTVTDGTLDNARSYATATVTATAIDANEGTVTLDATPTLILQQALVKVTLQDKNNNPITPSWLECRLLNETALYDLINSLHYDRSVAGAGDWTYGGATYDGSTITLPKEGWCGCGWKTDSWNEDLTKYSGICVLLSEPVNQPCIFCVAYMEEGYSAQQYASRYIDAGSNFAWVGVPSNSTQINGIYFSLENGVSEDVIIKPERLWFNNIGSYYLEPQSNVVYLALNGMEPNSKLSFNASVNGETLAFSANGVTYEEGSYYEQTFQLESTVKLTLPPPYDVNVKVDGVNKNPDYMGTIELLPGQTVTLESPRAYRFKSVNSVTYAVPENAVYTSGETVEVKNGNDVAATITFGETGGNNFTVSSGSAIEGFPYRTIGNNTNGDEPGGTFYTIVPSYDGTIDVFVYLNPGKQFFIEEEGTPLDGYNGITVDEKYRGPYSFNVSAGKKYKIYASVSKLSLYGFRFIPAVAASGLVVDYNSDKSTASFKMPASDFSVVYTMSRYLGAGVGATVNGVDAYNTTPRIPVKQDADGKYAPVSPLVFTLYDLLLNKEIKNTDYKLGQINRWNYNDGWTPMNEGDEYLPGSYRAVFTATETSDYVGTYVDCYFELIEGYAVTIPAGEYITYYSNEPLRVEAESGAQLYTISEVGETTATLSGPYDAMPSGTPMLVYNNTDVENTFLLIPCNEPDLAMTVAKEFRGTVDPMIVPGSDATTDNYAFNGKQFVWVKNAIEVGSNKAWLSIPKAPSNARSISLRRTTTGIGATLMNNEEMNNELYDLNGRKVQNPTKKGIYIRNGRKVVIMK